MLDDSNHRENFLKLKNELPQIKSWKNLFLKLLSNPINLRGYKEILTKLIEKNGIFPGKWIREFIDKKIQVKLGNENATFKDLYSKIKQGASSFKYIYLIGSNITTGNIEVFSHLDSPEMIISDAVRISMSIPFMFIPHKKYIRNEVKERVLDLNRENHFYVDGGLLNNYPIWIFDKKQINGNVINNHINMKTLGFSLNEPSLNEIEEPINQNLIQFGKSVVDFYFKIEFNTIKNNVKDKERTIFIDTKEINTLDFDLNKEKSDKLKNYGIQSISKYIEEKNNINK